MNGIVHQVQPGDLITADFMNTIVAQLQALEERVAALEGVDDDGSIAITHLIPSATAESPIRAGQVLRIIGRNFGVSLGAHRVFFDSIPVQSYIEAPSDTVLVVAVPTALSIPQSGRPVALTVSNGVATEVRTIHVLPVEQTLSGDIDVFWRDARSPNPEPNPIPTPSGTTPQVVTFFYRLRSRANLPAAFTIDPIISVPDWQNSLQVLDAEGSVLSGRQIQLAPNQEVNFAIRATLDEPSTSVTDFTLNVVASSGGVTGGLQRSFTLDVPVEEGDDQITLVTTEATVFNLSTGSTDPSGGSFDAASNTITVAPGFRLDLTFAATFQQAEVHNVTVQADSGTTNWDVQLRTPNTGVYDETGQAPPIVEAPRFSVVPQAGASPSGQVTFRIQRQGETQSQTRTYTLALLTP